MAKGPRRGFKASKHYDPRRNPKSQRFKPKGRQQDSDERSEQASRASAPRGTASRAAPPRLPEPRPRKLAESLPNGATVTTAAETEGVEFADLGLGGNIVRTLEELGAKSPFPIQAATIPDILRGKDVLGRAETGSGKTIAFGAAVVERLLQLKAQGAFGERPREERAEPLKRGERAKRSRSQGRNPKALIIAPTRELALQIDRTVQPIARSVGLYTAQVYGGVPYTSQLVALERGVDIVIGTPGRIEDLVSQRKLDLREIAISVIDEADHMCELGFLEPVQRILRWSPQGGQTLLFSATLDRDVEALVREFMRDPVAHEIAPETTASSRVEHHVFIVLWEHKLEVLAELARQPGKIVMFTRTRAFAEQVSAQLVAAGVDAIALHGDLSQHVRTRHLEQFTSGKVRVLVATDIAARGIHVDDIDVVVQADPPDDFKTYLHRAGRTGRAGRSGRVVTIIPRTRQKRTRALLDEAGIDANSFGDFVPGDASRDRTH